MEFVDYYELLQVTSTADADVIKAAYKRLALKYHPDTGGENKSEAKMKLLNEADEILSDATKRKMYDQVWNVENSKREKIKIAKALLDQKKYDEARGILWGVDHPTARKWIAQIDRIKASQTPKQNEKARYSPNNSNPSKTSESTGDAPRHRYTDATSSSRTKPIDPIEEEIQNIRERYDTVAAYRKAQIDAQNDVIRRRHERDQIMIAAYQRVGTYVFEFRGVAENRSTRGTKKATAFRAIRQSRYEDARKNILELLNWGENDDNIRDWLAVINHILANETLAEKLDRLGVIGVVEYPVKLLGCSSTAGGCIALLTCFGFLIFLLSASMRGDSNATNCLGLLVAAFFGWVVIRNI
jgi:curved DNA-binding protein CbpA